MKPIPSAALLLVLCVSAVGADERAMNLPLGDPARRDKEAVVVVDGITDTARGDVLTPPEAAARLDDVKLLFVGESHTDMDFHRVQLRVPQELYRRGRQVLIGLEMYPVTEQRWLDRWHSDRKLTEEGFLRESHWYRNWGYHWNYYRDIFLFARDSGARMFGVNVPRAVVQAMRAKGWDALTAEQKAMLPERIDTENAEHQRLFRAFFASADSLHGNLPDALFQGMFRAQCTWDAAMGWNALRALEKHGGEKAIMVVLIGAGHVAYGLGAERQARLWFDGRTASVIPVPIADPEHPKPVEKVQASYASFVWGLPPTGKPLYPSLGIATPEQKKGERYQVVMVAPDSPAAAAGFKLDDELVSMDGVPITDKETSNRMMSEKRWGDVVVYKVLRDGKEVTLTVFLRRTPPGKEEGPEPATGGGR
ncbi:MAG: ChaN family lipoprotein [Betaproteobacteria bacterium]